MPRPTLFPTPEDDAIARLLLAGLFMAARIAAGADLEEHEVIATRALAQADALLKLAAPDGP